MKIDKEKCIGCELCHHYCPVDAITGVEWEGNYVSEIDQDKCVECGACYLRSGICPTDAIFLPKLEWPRTIREQFSNPDVKHPLTTEPGRGTEEMKTNEITNRFPRGTSGVAIEIGRPGIGASLKDLQTIAMAMARLGVKFQPHNPVTALMVDTETGKIKDEVLNERVLSAIIEFKIENEKLSSVLSAIKEVAGHIDTVFSLDLVSRVEPDGSIPNAAVAAAAGFIPRPNMKTNVGLGRPLFKEA